MASNTGQPAVTQAELARRAGVTRLTIHRALLDRPGVSTATRRRIRELAREMGYRPPTSANARARRYNNVVLVDTTRPARSALPPRLLDAIVRSLQARHRHLLLGRLPDSKLVDPAYMAAFRRTWMCDGLLVSYHVGAPEAMTQLIEANRLPAVWLNTRRTHDAVYINDYDAGVEATRRLLRCGHRRIALFDASWNRAHTKGVAHESQVDRHSGYVDAMNQAGLTPRRIEDDPAGPVDELVTHMAEQLRGPDRPTALVVNTAERILTHTLWRLGAQVPEELSVVCLDFEPPVVGEIRYVSLSVPPGRVGELAAEMIDEKIETGRRCDCRAVDLVWQEGFSLAPPPAPTHLK